MKRAKPTKTKQRDIVMNPEKYARELVKGSLFHAVKYFWPVISNDELKENWHMRYLCQELEKVVKRVANNQPKEYDLIINIPPGSTKTTIISIILPVWAWINWFWMKFITIGYSSPLSLESAEYSRDIIRSTRFRDIFPELEIKEDKDTKSNYKIQRKYRKHTGRPFVKEQGGNRFSTSVQGTLIGFHGHVLIVDDPNNTKKTESPAQLEATNNWIDRTLSTRKTDKLVTPTIVVMQRLHENDVPGHLLKTRDPNQIKHICIPGEIENYEHTVNPPHLKEFYEDGLMDKKRMGWKVLKQMELELGQYGYAGQIGQAPTPPGGGMFQVDNFSVIESMPAPVNIEQIIRYWDKAGTEKKDNPNAARTSGTKIAKLKSGKKVVMDVVKGQWSAEKREKIIKQTAEADGVDVKIYIEQEPGSGGKESAESTIRNLSGYACFADRPTGDKIYRADPYSAAVNNGDVWLLKGDWNSEFIDEHRLFPYGSFKDQVDSAAGAFAKLMSKKQVKVL